MIPYSYYSKHLYYQFWIQAMKLIEYTKYTVERLTDWSLQQLIAYNLQ